MNSLIQKYRSAFSAAKDRTDAELLVMLGQEAEANGVLDQQPEDFQRDYRRYKDATAPSPGESFTTGVKRGVRGLGSTALGFGALVADWLPGTVADEYVRDPLLREAQELEAPRAGEAKALTWDDVDSPKTLASYLAQHTGNALPSVAESILVALAAGAATGGPGAAAGLVGKEGLKALAKSKLRNIMLAQGANSLALSSGEIYADLAKDKDVDDDKARYLATGLGVVAAIPDTIIPSYIAAKFVKPATDEVSRQVQKKFLVELGKEAAKVAPGEGATEAFQEWVGITAGKLAKGEGLGLTADEWKQMREAAVGGVAGGAIASPLAAYGNVAEPPAPAAPPATAAKSRPAAPLAEEDSTERTETRAEMTRRILAMSDDEQKLRFGALNRLTSPTPAEETERDFLAAMNATKWKQPAAPAATPAAASATLAQDFSERSKLPADPIELSERTKWRADLNYRIYQMPYGEQSARHKELAGRPELTEDEKIEMEMLARYADRWDENLNPPPAPVKPEEATPETPVAAVKAPEPLTATQIMQRTEKISARIARLVERGADVREAKRLQGSMIESGVFTRDGFASIEEALTQAEMADTSLRAKVKAGDAKLISDRDKEIARQKRDEAAAIRREIEMKRQDKQLAKLTEQLKKLYPAEPTAATPAAATNPQGPANSGAGSAPDLGAGVETNASAPVVLSAGRLVEPASEYGIISLKQAKETDWGTMFSKLFVSESGEGKVAKGSGVRKTGANARQTTIGVALLDPKTGRVHMRGLMKTPDLEIQNIARYKGMGAERVKLLNPEGTIPLKLEEVTSAGLIPIGHARFESAGRIDQDFASRDEYMAAMEGAEIAAVQADASTQKVAAEAARDAERGKTDVGARAVIREQKKKDRASTSQFGNKAVSIEDANLDSVDPEVAPAKAAKKESRYGTGPWEIRKGTKVVREIGLKEKGKDGKPRKVGDKFLDDAFAEAISGKSGTFTLIDGDGNTVASVTQVRATNRKKVIAEVIEDAELQRAFNLLSEVVDVENENGDIIGKSQDMAAALAAATKGMSEEEVQTYVRDFLRAKPKSKAATDFGIEGTKYIELLGGYSKARDAILAIISRYEQLASRRGEAAAQTDRGAGAGRGSVVPAERKGKSGSRKRAAPAGQARARADDSERRAGGRGKAGVSVGREEPDLDGRPLTEAELKDAAIKGIYKATSAFGKGLFTAELLGRFPENVREAVTDLLATRGMEWDDFVSYIQSAFDASNTADDFLAIMRGEPDAKASVETDAAEYESVQAEMKRVGYDKVGTPEFQTLWQRSEDIKNRNGGMPPTRFGETAPTFTPVGGYGVLNVVNPLTGKLESPMAAPDTVSAIEHNAAEAARRAKQNVDESSPASIQWTDAPPPDQALLRRIVEFSAELDREVAAADRKARRARSLPVSIKVKSPGAALSGSTGRALSFATAAELIGKVFKKRVVFVEIRGGAPGVAYRALTNRASDVIFINVASGVSVVKLIGHELTHNLKFQQPLLYRRLAEYIAARYQQPQEYADRILDTGRQAGTYDESDVNEEWVADIVGENFADPEFWKEFKARAKSEEQNILIRNLATYVGGWVSRIFQSLKRALDRNAAAVVETAKLQKTIAEVMSEYAGADQLAAPMLDESGDILASAEFIGEDNTENRMRLDAAVINEMLPVYEAAHRSLAPNIAFDEFLKTVLWKGDLPEARLAAIEKIARGTRQTTLNDMPQRMRAEAVAAAYTLARKNETQVREAAAGMNSRISDLSEEVTKLGKRINKIERGYQDAAMMNNHFVEQLKEIITGVAKDEGRKASAAFRLGELTQAVRMLESLDDGAPIPAEYQKVFERVLTSDTTSLFDHLQALAKLNLPLADMSVNGIYDAMKNSGVTSLASLTEQNRPLALALAALARSNQKEMDLLQVRVMAATAEKVEAKKILDDITTATDERLEQLWPAYSAMLKHNDVFARLAARYIRDRRTLRTKQTELRKLGARESLLNAFVLRLEEKRVELGKEAGDFANWAPADRGTYTAMRLTKDGKWVETSRTLYLSGPESETNGEQMHRDLAGNRAWLEQNRALKGTPLYSKIETQWQQLSKINFLRISKPAGRWFFDRFLASMSERFRQLGGVAAVNVSQMLQRYQFISRQGGDGGRTWHDSIIANAKRYEVALKAVTKAAGYHAPQLFMDDVRDHVIAYLESQTGKDIDSAIRGAARVARRYIPASNKISEDFTEKLGDYIRRLDEANRYVLGVAEKNGTFVEDGFISGWLRKAIPRGAITVSRRLRMERLVEAVEALDKAGWRENPFASKDESGETVPGVNQDGLKVLTDDVMRLVVLPYILKPGDPMFFGADKTSGDWSRLSQVEAQRAWEASDKTVLGWINQLFDATYTPTADANPQADRDAYTDAMLAKLSANANILRSTLAQTAPNPHNPESGIPLPHRMQDGRKNDIIPPDFLKYDTYDAVNSENMLNEIAYHAAFGRDGARIDALIREGGAIENELESRVRDYNRLRGVTESEKKRDALARGWNWNELKLAARDRANFRSLRAGFYTRFGLSVGLEQGPERAWWESLKTIAALVLNQPTSGLWNIPTILDFPLVVGGRMGYRASARAMKDVLKGLVGSPLSAAGINLFRMSDYWTTIVNARHGATQELSLKEHFTAVGKDAAYYEGGAANRATQMSRFVQNALRKGMRTKGGQLPFNGLWSPFNWISETVTTAVATGNVQNVEVMVKRAVEFFRNNADALNDPTYRLTAKDLGMSGPAYFNDERAFEYYTAKLSEFHLGSLEDMARDAMKRDRLLTDEQVMMIAQMAFNEISLESSINTRPMGWVENPVLRYGGLLLGWPLSQMDKTNRAFKSVDGRTWDPVAMGRAFGVLALWTLPMGLAFSFVMDEWDEEIVGKRSNRRDIDSIAALPGIGPIAAVMGDNAENNLFGMLERATKAGVYGIAADFVNGMTNIVDSKAGQREFSLDSRVLAFSQLTTIFTLTRNFIHQDGTYTYESVGRPLFMALGGNGLIQGIQIVSNMAGLDTEERLIAQRIGVGNYLRAAGRSAGIELKAGAGRVSPTPVTVWLREMYLAAIGNDRARFLESYRAAVAAARKAGEDDPEGAVLASWKRRSPLESVFARQPTESEMARLMQYLGADGRRAVQDVVRLYDDYTYMIEPTPAETAIRRSIRASARAADLPRPVASLYR